MQSNQAQLKKAFELEVENLCELLGLEERPKYSFRTTSKNSRVIPRFGRSPLVEIGADYKENPYALAAEAGHVVFDFARRQLRLGELPAYGEVFDYFNQIRRMHETGNTQEAQNWLEKSFRTRDPFIEKIEQIARNAPNAGPKKTLELMGKEFQKQTQEYGETINHMTGIIFIRLALKNMKSPAHTKHLMRTMCRRDTQFAKKIMAGDYSAFLDELNFFKTKPREISEALATGKIIPKENIPKRRSRTFWKITFRRK